jgi:WD repeat and SOF domain-containing protein 1
MRSNDLQWNPMEPMNFCVANEDYQAYMFDMRKLDEPTRIFKGHTDAVMSVSWSPTGREFATGSYDRTVRIFQANGGTSRDIYHTKRMQRVFTVQYSMDNTFIISGSDDSNLRLWKARASESLGQKTAREEASLQYRGALIKRFQHVPEVKQIHSSRKVPKVIKKQIAQSVIMKESADRKHANRVKYDRKGEHKFVAERKKTVVKEMD